MTTKTAARVGVLHLAPDLALPLNAVTGTFGVLARKGSGKTYTGSVMAEQMIGAGQPVCVIDPTGAWWGLRSSASGDKPGLPVVIFGGDHADVPLPPTVGALVAAAIVAGRFPAVLDLSHMSKTQERSFVTAFLEELYRTNRLPLHLIIDEADLFAPQRAFSGVERLLGAMEDVVRRGRLRGLGCTLITQRSASLNASVRSQVDTLIVMRMTGPLDIGAIDDWVRVHADPAAAKTVLASLPTLQVGEAWIWAPDSDLLQRIRINRRATYDSSATPEPGVTRAGPRQWATVDVAGLIQQLEDAASPAPAAAGDDTMKLRRRIAELELHMANTRPVVVEVPTLTDGERAQLDELASTLAEVTARLAALTAAVTARRPADAPPAEPKPLTVLPRAARTVTAASASDADPSDDRPMGKAERLILAVLAQHGQRTPRQVALLTRYSAKSGGFRNALAKLRGRGFIEGRGDLVATDDGLDALGEWEPLPTGRALVDWWCAELGKAERSILLVAVAAGPAGVTVDQVAERTGYSAGSGGFRNALSRLRSLELITGPRGTVVAAAELLP